MLSRTIGCPSAGGVRERHGSGAFRLPGAGIGDATHGRRHDAAHGRSAEAPRAPRRLRRRRRNARRAAMSAVERTVAFVLADLAGYVALTEAHGNAEAAGIIERFLAATRASLAPGARLIERVGDQVV